MVGCAPCDRLTQAEERAEKLFRSLLTQGQRRSWDSEGVVIERGWALYNVARGHNNAICWNLPTTVPRYDDLTFKLLAFRTGDAAGIRARVYVTNKFYFDSTAPTGPFPE